MEFYTPEQVAEILGVAVSTLANWRCHKPTPKGPPFTKSGRAILYRRDLLEAWIEANTVYPEKTAA